jgi:monofunctional biosynthetic peptidoglycan transglycosylase
MSPPRRPPTAAPRPRRWRRRIALACEVAIVIVATGALGLWCSVPDTARLRDQNPTSTAFIDLRRAEAAAAHRPWKLQWDWRALPHISRYLRAAVIYAEDDTFYTHDGVDWRAIEDAVHRDWRKGHLAMGGSTITQQLAKNLYLSPSRSLLRKLRELLIARSLERDLTKPRILELYLNVVEWGDGVFGAEAAARRWFGHGAAALTPVEAARLASALPNPFTRAPNVRTTALARKCLRLLLLMREQGLLDAAELRRGRAELGLASDDDADGPDDDPPDDRADPRATATSPPRDLAPGPVTHPADLAAPAIPPAAPSVPTTSPTTAPPTSAAPAP